MKIIYVGILLLFLSIATFAQDNVAYTNITGASVTGTTLTKTAADGWGNAGAESTNRLVSGANGSIVYTVTTTTPGEFSYGLSTSNPDNQFYSIGYAFHRTNGTLTYVRLNGTSMYSFHVAVNDVLTIERNGTDMIFKQNTTTVYTANSVSTAQMLVDVSMYSINGTLTDLKVNFPAYLSGRWKLNNDATDASGNSITGTLQNSPTYTTDAKEGSHSITLNGTSQYVDFGNPTQVPAGFTPRSISLWAKSASTSGTRHIVSYGIASTGKSMSIGMNGTSLVAGSYNDEFTVASFWATGVWHHLALTYDGVTAHLYADGTEVASGAKAWNLTRGGVIVGRSVNSNWFFSGQVDDVRIYSGSLSAAQVLALATVPPAPASPSATAASSTAINLSWTDASSTESGFAIERSTTSGSGYTLVNTTAANATTFQDTGLTASTTYYYRIRAVNDDNNSAYTSEFSAATQAGGIPNPPTGPAANALSSTSIQVTWTDASTNETGFEVERSLTSGSGFSLVNTTAANATSYSDPSLTPNTTYYYRVRSKNGSGTSAYTSVVNATTLVAPPNPPTSLSATAASSSSINLTWTDASTNETGFEIERSLTSGSGFSLINTTAANATSYSDPSLTANTTYYYRIRSKNAGGTSAYTSVANATTLNAPTQLCLGLTCDGLGNIGINTSTVPTGYKLAVNGKIIAEGIRIDLQSAWPDYVFGKNYNLRDLPSLRTYINQNKHLPGMPTATQVEKEGVDVGAVNVKLLEKIEELSLYMIQMEERIKKLETENTELKSKKNK